MSYTINDKTIALAGAYQAVKLVHTIANTGTFNERDFETCIYSIFQINIKNTEDAYNGITNIKTGLNTLLEQLGGERNISNPSNQKHVFITKYLISAMILEKLLRKNSPMLDAISSGIIRAKEQTTHFSITHENVISNLASLYTQTISTLKPRIMVHGEQVYLSNPVQANRIRALLLSAIRSIVLWRQCNGSRWGLLLNRRKYIESARMLLNS
jgi:high frequency lysogenization protein